MKLSFKMAKEGKRYNPYAKSKPEEEEKDQDQDSDNASSTHPVLAPNQILQNLQDHHNIPGSSASARNAALRASTLEQLTALGPSFSLNLFTNGYIFGHVEEFFHDVPQNLNRYDEHAKPVFKDIEFGRLPTGIIGDGGNYVNGTILCEVRDYRGILGNPYVHQVPLKMDVGNIIEDASSMPNPLNMDEQLILESRVVAALNPHINVDPTPTNFQEITRVIDLRIEYME